MDNETILRRLALMKKIVKITFNSSLIGVVVYFFFDNRLTFAQLVSTKNRIYFLLVVLAILSFYNFLFHKKTFAFFEKRRLWKKSLDDEEDRIVSFLNDNFRKCTSKGLEQMIDSLQIHSLSKQNIKKYGRQLFKHREFAKEVIEKLKNKEEIESLTIAKRNLQGELNLLANQKRQDFMDEEQKWNKIRRKLDLSQNVFLADDLNDEEIKVLKDERYTQTNEYDISQKRVVTALVRQVLNHSPTHIFLVWSTLQYIKDNLSYVTNLEEHETKDADITFKYNGKYYALEIETGTLLEKPRQLAEKVAYLNTKYRKRWMFVVSNKELISKYSKYAPATQRNRVAENLQKMLENSHPKKTGGKH